MIVKVVDFGIAKLRESAMHTQTGTVLGTPAYMSFEQASGMRSDELDARSDIYSMGVVVYEMLTGRTPFHSDTPVGYLRKHLMEKPPPFRAVEPGLLVPPRIESVVMKALTKDRTQRYGSVLEFFQEFAQAGETGPNLSAQPQPQREGTKAQPLATATPVPKTSVPVAVRGTAAARAVTETARPPRRKWLVLTSVVALISITGGTWYFSQHRLKKGEVRVNPKDGLKYVWIPAGTFMMGCSPGDTKCDDNEKPPHQVTITRGFWLGQTPVTVGAYKRFAGATEQEMPPAPDFNKGWTNENMPIVNVTWDEAQAYCGWAGGRLPTEAEWEYAARGGSTEARYGPVDEIAWYTDNSGRERLDGTRIWDQPAGEYYTRLRENGNGAHEVAQKRANGFGLYDMLGNVKEWVSDWYDDHYYQSSPSRDPQGPPSWQERVLRGGSWDYHTGEVRVSNRNLTFPSERKDDDGFRCGREVVAPYSKPPAPKIETPRRAISAPAAVAVERTPRMASSTCGFPQGLF